jgi:hypothetical protein
MRRFLLMIERTFALRRPTKWLERELGAEVFLALAREGLLVPSTVRACLYPCARGRAGCVRHIATAANGGPPFVAMCESAEACKDEQLDEAALHEHVFAPRVFVHHVRTLFDVAKPALEETGQPGVVRIGSSADGADVFLCYAPDDPELGVWLRAKEAAPCRSSLLVTTHSPESTTRRICVSDVGLTVVYLTVASSATPTTVQHCGGRPLRCSERATSSSPFASAAR